jgi:hypothetical protein
MDKVHYAEKPLTSISQSGFGLSEAAWPGIGRPEDRQRGEHDAAGGGSNGCDCETEVSRGGSGKSSRPIDTIEKGRYNGDWHRPGGCCSFLWERHRLEGSG